jgi:hypothetical protein
MLLLRAIDNIVPIMLVMVWIGIGSERHIHIISSGCSSEGSGT